MSTWIEVRKSGQNVEFENSDPFSVGQQVKMGLGSIELRDTKNAGLHIVRLSSGGNFTYSLRLTRDGSYRLGPSRGHRVVLPSEETDPIKRILREMDIPVSKLTYANEPTLEVTERHYDNWHCPVGHLVNHWVTDGNASEVSVEVMERPQGYFLGGEFVTKSISGATYAISVSSGKGWHGPEQIVVWPDCRPENLGDALARTIWGENADAKFMAALKNFDLAQEWSARYKFEQHPTRTDRILVNGEDTPAPYGYPEKPALVVELVRVHGGKLIEDRLPAQQRELIKASQDEESATEYILRTYRVVAIEGGDGGAGRRLKYGVTGKTGLSFSSHGDSSIVIGEERDRRLEFLLQIHKRIESALWEKTPERRLISTQYPNSSGFQLEEEVWKTRWDNPSRQYRSVFPECNGVPVTLWKHDNLTGAREHPAEELFRGAVCLSDPKRPSGWDALLAQSKLNHFPYWCAFLADGSEAHIGNVLNGKQLGQYVALFPVPLGVERSFVIVMRYGFVTQGTSSIWGVTIANTREGVEFRPFDNGRLYSTTTNSLGWMETTTAPLP